MLLDKKIIVFCNIQLLKGRDIYNYNSFSVTQSTPPVAKMANGDYLEKKLLTFWKLLECVPSPGSPLPAFQICIFWLLTSLTKE